MAIQTEYDFIQQIDYSYMLQNEIQQSSIATPLSYINTFGSGPTMAISIFFSDVLSAPDVITLNSLLAAHINTPPTVIDTSASALVPQIVSDGSTFTISDNTQIYFSDQILTQSGGSILTSGTGSITRIN